MTSKLHKIFNYINLINPINYNKHRIESKQLDKIQHELKCYLELFNASNPQSYFLYDNKNPNGNSAFLKPKCQSLNVAIDMTCISREIELIVNQIRCNYRKANHLEDRLLELSKSGYAKLVLSLIENNQIVFVGFKPYTFSMPFDWDVDPFESRTWCCNLHQFKVIKSLLAYDLENRCLKGLELCERLIISWVEKHLFTERVEPVWHDHSTALRARNLFLLLIYYLKNYQLLQGRKEICVNSFIVFLVKMFQWHISVLQTNDFYSKGTNHGLDQSLALFELSAFLDFYIENQQYNRLAASRIAFEISKAFTKDGGHSENSPGYLNFGLKQINDALKLNDELPESTKIPINKKLLDKATIALTYLTKPNQKLPLIGDTVDFRVSDVFTNRLKPTETIYQNFIYSRSKGIEGIPPTNIDLFLEDSGYAIFRDKWYSKENFINTTHLVLKSGFLSKYHRHDDDTSLVLFGHGEDWLIDSGLYIYEEANPIRKYMRSSDAHNLSTPCDIKPTRNIKKVKSRLKVLSNSESKSCVRASTNMFPKFYTERVVEHEKSTNTFKVIDSSFPVKLRSRLRINKRINDKLPTYVTRFHIPKDKKVEIFKNHIKITGRTKNLIINVDSADEYIVNKCTAQIDPMMMGWSSVKGGIIEECNVLELNFFSQILSVSYNLTFNEK